MPTIIVTNLNPDGQGSLAQAIHTANLSPEADTIKFDLSPQSGPVVVQLGTTIEVLKEGGDLIIDGDSDGDGLSDVVLKAGEGQHLTVQTGAKATIRNVDFIGGDQQFGGEAAENGAHGANGAFGGQIEELDGADGVDGGAVVNDGEKGSDGANGKDAIGAILNYGDLTLERVGFASNTTHGGIGGSGGWGGKGGGGQIGGNALYSRLFDYLDRNLDENDFNGALTSGNTETFASLPGSLNNPYQLVTPGHGGNGGIAGNGGQGGDGGRGGRAAGGIFNDESASLTLVDVTFGGILGSGLLGGGNVASGGLGGGGGRGGAGGIGGDGGDGGTADRGIDFIERHDFAFGAGQGAIFVYHYASNDPGAGGAGARGGNGGTGGADGDGGAAGSIVNLGLVQGTAAFSAANAYGGDTFDQGGPGGQFGRGGFGGDNGTSWVPESAYLNSLWFDNLDELDPGEVNSFDFNAAWTDFRVALAETLGLVIVYNVTLNGRSLLDGANGEVGQKGALGAKGEENVAIVSLSGSVEVDTAQSLIYLANLGQVGDELVFNIVRTGSFLQDATVNWRIEGIGDTPVDGFDFGQGLFLPAGQVLLPGRDVTDEELLTPTFDRSALVSQVSIPIVGANPDDQGEGYRIVLEVADDPTLQLGTHSALGSLYGDLPPTMGYVVDDYISGAEIFVDANFNGVPDANEGTGVLTGIDGSFEIDPVLITGPLIAVGGVDTGTGLNNQLILKAPQDKTLLNPLTTLIQSIVQVYGQTTESANELIRNVFDLDGSLDLTEYDPLAQNPVDATALSVQIAAAQIGALVTLTGSNATFDEISDWAWAAPQDLLDLSDFDTLKQMLPEVDDEVLVHVALINGQLNSAQTPEDIFAIQEQANNDTNDTPVLIPGMLVDQTITEGIDFEYQVTSGAFVDYDADDMLTYSATLDDDSPLPGWLSFDPQSQTFSGTPDVDDIGQIAIKITATDKEAESTSGIVTVNVEEAAQGMVVEGTEGPDSLVGDTGNDTIRGFGGQDTLEGLAGNDVLEGGDDIDVAVFDGDIIEFSVLKTDTNITVSGPTHVGTDELTDIERLQFNDLSMAFDLGPGDNATLIVELLGVALGKDNWYNRDYIGIGLDLVDNSSISPAALMDLAFSVVLGSNPSNEAVVSLIYTNLIGATPTPQIVDSFVAEFFPALTQGELGALALTHELNTTNIDLIGLSMSGVEFII